MGGGNSTIAYWGYFTSVLVAVIGGIALVRASGRTKSTVEDASASIGVSVERLGAFETLYLENQRLKAGQQYWEDRCDRLEAAVIDLRRQLEDALNPPEAP